ncbi:MAG: methyltransferase domain-containing protein [Phycisphaerales bacterium]|jgi:2-polyprenyl-3-methyl-5-hydroxy-6-metoxy-1,4-benzoquinol methylase
MSGHTPFQYNHADKTPHSYLVYGDRPINLLPTPLTGKRVLDVGCGNGFWSGRLSQLGATVVGLDGSVAGISIAKSRYPALRFEQIYATSTLLADLGEQPFDGILSVEVIEHLVDPRGFIKGCVDALKPGGVLVLTTPYHGYLKNLAISIAGKWDHHLNPLWDSGHLKMWSRATLSKLLVEYGLTDIKFCGMGRVPYLWMGMALSGRKPG